MTRNESVYILASRMLAVGLVMNEAENDPAFANPLAAPLGHEFVCHAQIAFDAARDLLVAAFGPIGNDIIDISHECELYDDLARCHELAIENVEEAARLYGE